MAGRRKPQVEHEIPLRTLVRDRNSKRMGVLISYGTRAARVQFALGITNQFWIKLRDLEPVPEDEIEAMRRKQLEDLV